MQTTCSKHLARMAKRSACVHAIRTFFHDRDFLEVDTPVALSTIALEPHIDGPKVQFSLDQTITRYLQTSPELPMKRLLAQGFSRIYQIAPVFRDTDFGPHHRPEFKMLEWYRRDASFETLMQDCEALIRNCCLAVHDSVQFVFQNQTIDVGKPFVQMPMEKAFLDYAGFSIVKNLDVNALQNQLGKIGLAFDKNDSWDDLFHRVFLNRVEPELTKIKQPVFLTHYPALLSALARLCPEDQRVCERFELFAGGLELANGFGELTSRAEQQQRFEHEYKRREALGLSTYPLDQTFLECLDAMPPSSGIALGLDRLLMFFLNASCIDDVAFIPWTET